MASRMDRYYDSDADINNRSQKNKDLYDKMYGCDGYTNIESITNIENINEVDISKIKELLRSREDYQKSKNYLKMLQVDRTPKQTPDVVEEDDDDRNYDINDVLSKARGERSNETDYHSLKNTQYNILKNIHLNDNHVPQVESESELKSLINTITNTSMLNKLGDKELSLDILDELKSSGDTIFNGLEMTKHTVTIKSDDEDIPIDKSFFTNGLDIKDKDFEDVNLKDINNKLEKNNKLIRIILLVLSAIIVVGGLVIIWILWK